MNLDRAPKRVELAGLSPLKVAGCALRTLTTHGDEPVLSERKLKAVPTSLKLAQGEAALLLIDLEKPVRPVQAVREHRVYATEYLKDINAGQPVGFTFRDVPTGSGTAVLRISPGRELGKQVLPDSVTMNGRALAIPTNWAGDDQAGRANFFGMIEVPVLMNALQKESRVEIRYPDSGGKVACVVLQVNRSKTF
jgi:hypothetical protein